MGGDFETVQPLGAKEIERYADALREAFGLGVKDVQMINLVEVVLPEVLPGYQFEVLPDENMPNMAGFTKVNGERQIYLSDSTYEALYNGDPEARHVAAHEFGHLMLHSHQTPVMAKRTGNDDRVDPEMQADRFADCWLAPSEGVRKCRSPQHVAAKYNITDELAERRYNEVLVEGIQGELF